MPRRVPITDWPEADRRDWTAARAPGDLLGDSGAAAHWRPATALKVETAVKHFLGWAADEAGLSPAPMPELATARHLRAYIDWLTPRLAPVSIHGLIVDLGEYYRVVWPGWPREHLKRAEAALRHKAVPSRDKTTRLRPVGELVRLGEHLMATIEATKPAKPELRCARYRDGLIIALLALRPLRLRAFVSLQLGPHVQRVGDRWRLVVPAELAKTHRPWEAELPACLEAAFTHYVEVIRPQLLMRRGRWHRESGQALWISIDGSPLTREGMKCIVEKRTRAAFGTSLPPHFFRDCAATTLALDSPASVRLAAPLLGHADPRTTQKHYNQAQSLDAGRRHLTALRALRRPRS